MDGLASDNVEIGVVLFLTIFAPLLIIFGIPLFMNSIGLNIVWVLLGGLFNLGIVLYLMIKWNVIEFIKSSIDAFQY